MVPNSRFACRYEKETGTWAVWDGEQNTAASLAGHELRGRTEQRARVACDVLTAIYRGGLDYGSVSRKHAPAGAPPPRRS